MKAKAYQGDEPYVFVSYSHRDPKVQEIIQEMVDNRYRVWYDEGIESGSSWGGTITRRLKGCTQFLVFLSRNSILSENVKDEVGLAKKRKLDIQVIYLDDLDESSLDEDLELWLSRIQSAVYRKDCPSDRSFLMEILKILNEDTRESYRGQARELLDAKYEIREMVSRSSISKNYKGIRKDWQIPVFIKHFRFSESKMGDVIRNSLRGEIRTYCVLSSCPYVPTIYDVYEDEEESYVVESFVAGTSAEKLLEEKFFASVQEREKWCVDVIAKAAQVLRYFHRADPVLVHRDIKPKNLMVSSFDDVFLVDLGTCMEWTPELKRDKVCLGTAGYAAPEQYGGLGASDPRTDIHALGMTLLHLLTGVAPGNTQSVAPWQKLLRSYDAAFHPGLEEIIVRATQKDRNLRYQSVEELIAALRNYRELDTAELIKKTAQSERRVVEELYERDREATAAKPSKTPKARGMSLSEMMQYTRSQRAAPPPVPPLVLPGKPQFAVPVPQRTPIDSWTIPAVSVGQSTGNMPMYTTVLSDEMGTTVLSEHSGNDDA